MLSFVVKVKGLDDDTNKARWVLAVDPDVGVLVVREDRTLGWYPLEDCTFVNMVQPDAPMPVVPVKLPEQPPKIARPTSLDLRNGGLG